MMPILLQFCRYWSASSAGKFRQNTGAIVVDSEQLNNW